MASRYLETVKGSSILWDFAFAEDGEAIDLTDKTVAVKECSPDFLSEAEITVTDAENGLASFALTEDQADQFSRGLMSWFTIEIQLTETTNIVFPKVWIYVK